MTAPSYPPVLDPRRAKLIAGYRRHLTRVAPELAQHEAEARYDRTVRACMAAIRELSRVALDRRDAVLAEAEPLEDWQAIAEERRGR